MTEPPSAEPEPVAARKWALEQAVKYADRSNINHEQVVRIADKFRRYLTEGTVPR